MQPAHAVAALPRNLLAWPDYAAELNMNEFEQKPLLQERCQMLLPSQNSSERVRFYVKTSEGAYIESDHFVNQEVAEEQMKREYWKGRKPCVVKITIIEEVVVRGE